MSMTHDEVIAAHRDGEAVQDRRRGFSTWRDHADGTEIHIDLVTNEYRIKPVLTVRPWTIAEVPVGAVVINKDSANPSKSVIIQENGIFVRVGARGENYTTSELLACFTMLDGTPCGVEVAQ